jgi:hypothetical protein
MKNFIILIFCSVLLISFSAYAESLLVEDELWMLGSYSDDGDIEAGFWRSVSCSAMEDEIATAISFKLNLGERYQGVDIFTRDGNAPIFALDEFYIRIRGSHVFGKQIFINNGVKFDFASIDPFETRDLSEPFSALDRDKFLGNWGIFSKFINERLETIFLLHEPPVLALDSENFWTRELPTNLHYGDVKNETHYSLGLRWLDSWGNWDYELFTQHGSGNSPVDIEVDKFGRVRPIISEQFSVGGAVQFPLWKNIVRAGLTNYFQAGYSDFTVGILEIERIWENIISLGDSLFLDIGLADVWELEGGKGASEIDMRRIYEGGTLLTTAEYSKGDWLFKLKGAYNIEHEGVYIAPEIVWRGRDLDLSLKYEIVEGKSSKVAPLDNIWSAHSDDDMLSLKLIFYF